MLKKVLILFGFLLTLYACNKSNVPEKSTEIALPAAPAANVITFVTLNSPNTYYVNSDKQFAGLEYDLAKLFAEYLNKETPGKETQVKFIVADSIEKVIATIINKQADIAASDLTITEARKHLINFSQPYQDVQEQVIYNQDTDFKPPKNVKDLVDVHLVVPAATSFAERLTNLRKSVPYLTWEERDDVHSEKLIEAVANGEVDYTVADSHLVAVLQNYHPNIGVAFSLGEPEKIAWGFSKTANPELLAKANTFFTKVKNDGTLRNLIDRYHGNAKRLKPIDVKSYLSKSRTLLPKYKRLFQQAQEITGLDWRLLAAISYQESHWDTYNTSPTNVRGLMMLTEDTADRMGVTDRLDPKQSIPAGAKYISQMIDTVPDRIPEPDRTFMALAAYNIGYAHVEDARVLAERLNMNPDSWADVKKTLVMLNDPKYYSNAKYGYCSGGAPVIFVESIRSYHNILTRYEPSYNVPEDNYKIAGEKMILAKNFD
ncbi:MAG: membrane-bound lytic murein transglycosylase MltF [Methylophilaceae bacterium]